MNNHILTFPFFRSTVHRILSKFERDIVDKIVSDDASEFQSKLDALRVVGRCGCGVCPTIFFQPHIPAEQEQKIAEYGGKDKSNGMVGAILWKKNERLSQLEFYSVDGREPWGIPNASTLEKY